MTLRLPKPARRSPKPRKPISRGKRPRRQSRRPSAVSRRAEDDLWAEMVKSNAGGCCQFPEITGWYCPCCPGLDAHHVYGKKAHPELRHLIANGVALCRVCHQWAHRNARAFRAKFAAYSPTKHGQIMRLKK